MNYNLNEDMLKRMDAHFRERWKGLRAVHERLLSNCEAYVRVAGYRNDSTKHKGAADKALLQLAVAVCGAGLCLWLGWGILADMLVLVSGLVALSWGYLMWRAFQSSRGARRESGWFNEDGGRAAIINDLRTFRDVLPLREIIVVIHGVGGERYAGLDGVPADVLALEKLSRGSMCDFFAGDAALLSQLLRRIGRELSLEAERERDWQTLVSQKPA